MVEYNIEDIIAIAEQKESDAHGGNKKCYLIDNYALLRQKFTTEEIDGIIQIGQELASKGIRVVKTLDYKVLSQSVRGWNTDKNRLVSEGYVLQQRAKGNPLLHRTNWNKEGKKYQLDYLRQINSISQEKQEFFSNFVRDWIEIQKAGLGIDPSKTSNFVYEQGKGINFIDLDLSNRKSDIQTTIHEQFAILYNPATYGKCYPEIQQAVDKRLSVIIEKYRNAIIEQGMDIDTLNEVLETRFSLKRLSEGINQEEITESEIERLGNIIKEHIKIEEIEKEQARKLQVEREEKVRIEREKRKAEERRIEEAEERQNGGKRNDSKMYAILYGLIEEGVIPKNQAEIFRQVFQIKRNIYADLNPQLFKKQGTRINLSSVISNIEDNNTKIDMRNMKLDDNGNLSNENYEQIRIKVEDYFKQYFENISQNAEAKMLEYSKMKEMHESGKLTEEQYIQFILLEAELNEFSNAKELFPALGIDEKLMENSDMVSNFLKDKNKITEEEKIRIENQRRENDRDYLGAVFEGTGITDPAELRKLYYEQDEIRVTEEDLEMVLANFSNTNIINPTQIGKATARKGIGITEINQTTQEIRKTLEKDLDKNNELSH